MDWQQVAEYWDGNADAWTTLSRAGFDICRDHLNTPAFLAMLPPVDQLSGLDIGCGEGHNTRVIASRGAGMIAVDISPKFIDFAKAEEQEHPQGIKYQIASATQLPFESCTFDFAVATMCLMDIAETATALREAYRVLKPGGFFQFSITHPCFQTPRYEWLEREGEVVGIICGDYFERDDSRVEQWTFSNAPAEVSSRFEPFKVPRFDRTLSEWLNTLIECGFKLERVSEPCPSEAAAREHPTLQKYRLAAMFLHILCRK